MDGLNDTLLLLTVYKLPLKRASLYFPPGWLFKISLSNPEELKKLMNEAQYEIFLKTADDH